MVPARPEGVRLTGRIIGQVDMGAVKTGIPVSCHSVGTRAYCQVLRRLPEIKEMASLMEMEEPLPAVIP